MIRQARPAAGLPGIAPGIALLAAVLAHAPARAQEPVHDKPWRLGEAIGAPAWLSVAGSTRARYETLEDSFYAGVKGSDQLLSLQTLVRVEAASGDLVLGGELLDARWIAGDAGGRAPGEVNTLEPAQAYLAWRPKGLLMRGDRLDLTLGRFTMDLGSRRLIARALYRNLLQTFDGIDAVWTSPDKIRLSAFYVSPTTRAPSDAASARKNRSSLDDDVGNVGFWGAHVETPLPGTLISELYLLGLREKDDASLPTQNRDLTTLGARLRRAPATSAFDLDLEYAGQTGSVRATSHPSDAHDLDHEAYMLHLEAGYTFDAPWSPRIVLEYDAVSGDRSPGDGSSQRFDNLFGDRAFDFGPTSLYGAIARTNLASPGLRIEVKPDNQSEAYVMARSVSLDAPRDAFGASGVRDPTGASGREVGQQVEGRYRRWLTPSALRLTLGAAYLAAGEFLRQAPNATGQGDTLYGYSELTWTF